MLYHDIIEIQKLFLWSLEPCQRTIKAIMQQPLLQTESLY